MAVMDSPNNWSNPGSGVMDPWSGNSPVFIGGMQNQPWANTAAQEFGAWTPDKYQGALSPAMLNGIKNQGWSYAPGSDVSGNNGIGQFVRDPVSGEIQYHPQGQGAGEQYYTYDGNNGNFLRTDTGAKNMTNWQGILAVAGAGLGFGALGAAAGGAGAAGAADAGAGAGATGAGGAGVTGFGDAGTMYAGANAADAATLGGGGSFTGAGMDAAYAGGAGSSAMGAGGSAGAGTPPPANPYASSSPWSNLMDGSGSTADWLKLGSLAAGALGGSKGVQKTATQTSALDPRMDSLVYGDLAPYTRNLLAGQGPQAQLAGAQMLSTGSGLLGQTAPTTATNPYLKSIADDMQLRTKELLGQNNLDIQGNAVATGSLGGARQGVAQGVAAGKAADYLQGNVANLYGTAYTGDQNRLLQQQTLGAGLLSQGLDTMWAPAKNAAQIYSPFTGFGGTTTATQSQGGGTMGAVGGAIGAYGMGKQLGWW